MSYSVKWVISMFYFVLDQHVFLRYICWRRIYLTFFHFIKYMVWEMYMRDNVWVKRILHFLLYCSHRQKCGYVRKRKAGCEYKNQKTALKYANQYICRNLVVLAFNWMVCWILCETVNIFLELIMQYASEAHRLLNSNKKLPCGGN